MVNGPTESSKAETLAGRLGPWLGIYVAYLFFAGWTYLDFYFAVYGINAQWLDLGVNDVIARGFVVLFDGGIWLSSVYLLILLLSLIADVLGMSNRLLNVILVFLLAIGFIPTYFIAKNAGVASANIDRSGQTHLASITFSDGGCVYRGDLVYLKGDALYVNDLKLVSSSDHSPSTGHACHIQVVAETSEIPQLRLIRLTEIQDVRVVHYSREVRP